MGIWMNRQKPAGVLSRSNWITGRYVYITQRKKLILHKVHYGLKAWLLSNILTCCFKFDNSLREDSTEILERKKVYCAKLLILLRLWVSTVSVSNLRKCFGSHNFGAYWFPNAVLQILWHVVASFRIRYVMISSQYSKQQIFNHQEGRISYTAHCVYKFAQIISFILCKHRNIYFIESHLRPKL
jgi:hypothetical protein